MLIIDLLACVPILIYELLHGFTVDEQRVRKMISSQLYFFCFALKICKIGMLSRLTVFASIIAQRLDQLIPHVNRTLFSNIAEGSPLLVIFCITTHWFACIWIGFRSDQGSSSIASFIPLDTTKLSPKEITSECFNVYANSFHFIVTTMTTIGYGDIKPQNATERVFGILLQFGVLLIFSLIKY